ncbi:MAG TPA: tripartite tricarboxylate transporter TctB family protein [Caldimonas sp.]
MSEQDAFDPALLSPAEARALAASELRGAVGWIAFGVAILAGSVAMDRLENQGVNPYTVPGLLPGLLGIAMILLGGLLGLRSWQRGGAAKGVAGFKLEGAAAGRLALVIGLILLYAVVLIGHGMPFWLASTLYVTVSIVTLQRPQRLALGRRLSWRDLALALAVGLGSGIVITFVFQELFLVRLP